MDKAIVCALIDAQNALGDVSAELTNTESTSIEYEVSDEEEATEPNVVEASSEETLDIFLQIFATIVNDEEMAVYIDDVDGYGIITDTASFKQSADYTDLPAFSKAVLDAFITAYGTNQAEIEGDDGYRVTITWTDDDNTDFGDFQYPVILTDDTVVNGMTWTDLKEVAMSEGYTDTTGYTDLSLLDKVIVDELILNQEDMDQDDSPFDPAEYETIISYFD